MLLTYSFTMNMLERPFDHEFYLFLPFPRMLLERKTDIRQIFHCYEIKVSTIIGKDDKIRTPRYDIHHKRSRDDGVCYVFKSFFGDLDVLSNF